MNFALIIVAPLVLLFLADRGMLNILEWIGIRLLCHVQKRRARQESIRLRQATQLGQLVSPASGLALVPVRAASGD